MLRQVCRLSRILTAKCNGPVSLCRTISAMSGIKYPKPRRDESVKEKLHGVTICDPYRWMEDPDSAETISFVEAQNDITRPVLESCPHRQQLKESLTKLWNYPKYGAPSKHGERYYYNHNTGLQNLYVMYSKKDLTSEPEVFLDPNTLSKDGTISLGTSEFSEQGNYYAYSLSESGSDWSTIHIKDTRTKEDLPEKLERFRYAAISWTHDEKGFFYGQYPDWTGKVSGTESKAVENQKTFYHKLGTSQTDDLLCVEFPDHPKWRVCAEVSDCGKYVVVNAAEGCQDNVVYVADISSGVHGQLPLKCIYGKFDCKLNYIANNGTTFYFKTNKNRPNYALVQIDINKPEEWIDVIPAHEKNVLEWATCVDNDKFVVCYLQDVVNVVQVNDFSGKLLQPLELELGTINGFSGKRKDKEVFLQFTSFLTPGIIYRCEINEVPNARLQEFQRIKLGDINTNDFTATQKFYESKDGTKVPMFICHKKGQALDGTAPCLLYVYGGFNISLTPSFSLFRLMLIKTFGFVTCVANVRGGGEYGEKWHNGGRLKNKQNTFDDVHAAAEYLETEGYTKAAKLVLMGGSNGGMVTTASINQKPELFGAGIAQVPVTDLFRFHKFTVGSAWCSDFGSPDNKEDFTIQSNYSPLHNIPSAIENYPNMFVMTADHDDRVVPSHSLKFIAELQHRLGSKNINPFLVLIDTKAGHGAGKPTEKVIQDLVEIMCFLHNTLKLLYRE